MTWPQVIMLIFLAVQATIGAVVAAAPGTLGLDPRIIGWLLIAEVPIGIVINQIENLPGFTSPKALVGKEKH